MTFSDPHADSVVSIILARLDAMDVERRYAARAAADDRKVVAEAALRVERKVDDALQRLERVEKQTVATNGRVSGLEVWRARMDGLVQGVRWVPTGATAVATALVVYGLTR